MSQSAGQPSRMLSVMVLGVGSFAHSTTRILKDKGAKVSTYLTRDYGHYGASLCGPVFQRTEHASPASLIERDQVDLVIPMSIDWAQAPWKEELLATGVRVFSPVGDGMKIERERDFARQLCREFHIPFPESHVARNRLEAEALLAREPRPYVLKNPLCSPTSPIHTIVCETAGDTRSWLKHLDYAEGVFMQEYLGPREAGHIALVSDGDLYPLATNQEYKRAFAGNMGIVAGAPLGGLVEKDPGDKYGLAEQLLQPLLPWLRQVNFHGPIQVTAVQSRGRWHVIEYNVRIGVTSGAMILRLLQNPTEVLAATASNEHLNLRFTPGLDFGCSLSLAGYGYPYVQLTGPRLPVDVNGTPDCDLWWNEVALDAEFGLLTTGHRIADVVAVAGTLEAAISKAYANIARVRSLGSYYRGDIGKTLWPPGHA